MKNKFLLVGATALLSAGAMGVMADNNISTQLDIKAAIVGDLPTISTHSPLNFGILKNGTSQGFLELFSDGTYAVSEGAMVIAAPKAGIIRIAGWPDTTDRSEFLPVPKLNIPEDAIELTPVEGSSSKQTCGIVSDLAVNEDLMPHEYKDGNYYFYVGGIWQVPATEPGKMAKCIGNTTITLILEDYN